MDWVAKIIKGMPDESVHAKMIKYGVGEHVGPRMKLSFTSSKITIKADLDLERVLTQAYISCTKSGRHRVTGNIFSYAEPRPQPKGVQVPLDWSKTGGAGPSIFKARLDEVMPADHLPGLLEYDSPTTFYFLSFAPADDAAGGSKVTIKPNFPKGGVGGTADVDASEEDEGDSKDPTFAKATFSRTPEIESFIMQEILPDVKEHLTPKSKNILIRHTIAIENIEIPEDPSLSFSEKRRLAKKIGRLVRRVTIDDKEYVFTYPFRT